MKGSENARNITKNPLVLSSYEVFFNLINYLNVTQYLQDGLSSNYFLMKDNILYINAKFLNTAKSDLYTNFKKSFFKYDFSKIS